MSAAATPADVLAGNARWCVVEGDCADVLRALGDGSVGVTLTDPPYNPRTHKGARASGGKLLDATTVDFDALADTSFFAEALRVSKRWTIAFCAAEQLGEYERTAGNAWIRAGIWVRVGASPQFTGDRPAVGADAIAIAHRKGRKRWNGGGSHAVWTHGFAREEMGTGRVHPTQKPLRLMVELVRLFTDPGEVILDPFAGSGTTGEAALIEGRRVILAERDAGRCAIARARLAAAESGADWRAPASQPSLFAAVGS